MLDFIMIPLVVGIITLGIFKLFELFARRKERILLIEKMSENIDSEKFNAIFPQQTNINVNTGSFASLKIGCLLFGLGLGLLVGFLIVFTYNITDYQLKSMAIGSTILLAGGIGLLIAFFVEQRFRRKDKENK